MGALAKKFGFVQPLWTDRFEIPYQGDLALVFNATTFKQH
jgi:hypothetical protein